MNVPHVPISFHVSFDNLLAMSARSPAEVQAILSGVAFRAAERAKEMWIDEAVYSNARFSGQYIQGIQNAEIREVTSTGADGSLAIRYEITNHAPHASIVEDGHSAFHLPSRINWAGPKVKYGKKGPYMHIPMSHSAYQSPSQQARSGATLRTLRHMLPPEIHRVARTFQPRHRLNAGPQYDAHGRYLAADKYTRGDALVHTNMASFISGRAGTWESRRTERRVGRDASGRVLTNPAWQGSKFSGVFRTGQKGHSAFMSVRTITPHSKGWNIPAAPGFGIARRVAHDLNGGAGQAWFNAVIEDALRELLP